MLLYTIFKHLAFRNLCLGPNDIDFVLSCPKCIRRERYIPPEKKP